MSISVKEFWKLAIDSRLLTLEECRHFHGAFTRVPGSDPTDVPAIAQWLTTNGVLSRYQASALVAGRLQPFVFGDYKVFERHESGRLKGLFRAAHLPTGQSVLLYFLARNLAQDPARLAQVQQQAQAWFPLRDDHLCRVFELGDANGVRFLVLDDLQGISLDAYLAKNQLPPPDACRVVRSLAEACATLHAGGLAHGDIRPSNVWLASDGGVKLLGFPLCRDPAANSAYRVADGEKSSRLVAAADYLAPELAHGRKPDPASDLYSLGCLLYQLLAGRVPFAGATVEAKLAGHATLPAVPLDQYGVPAPVAQLVAHLMAKNPPVRQSNASQLIALLAPFAAPDPTAGRVPTRAQAAFEQQLAAAAGRAASSPPPPVVAAPAVAVPAIAAPPPPPGMNPGIARPMVGAIPAPPPMVGVAAVATAAAAPAPPPAPALPEIDYSPRPSTRRKPGRASGGPNKLIVGASIFGACILLAVVGGLVYKAIGTAPTSPGDDLAVASNHSTSEPTEPGAETVKPVEPKATQEKPAEPADSASPQVEVSNEHAPAEVAGPRSRRPEPPPIQEVDDDGRSLWISPTSGGPISFRYLPAGSQVFLIVRPADILSNEEGARMVAGLGPASVLAAAQIKATTGVAPEQIDQLIIAFYPNDVGPPKTALVVRLKHEISETDLLTAWHNPTPVVVDAVTYFTGPASAYYLPAEEQGLVFAITAPGEMAEVIKSPAPPLTKEFGRLLADSDAQRHLTVLASPFVLFTDTKTIFVGELERLQRPLERFLGSGVQAVMLSCFAGNDFFLEMRICGPAEEDPVKLATFYRTQLEAVPNAVSDYIATLPLQPYSKNVLLRFPDMIRLMENFTRVGEEHRQAVLRCYLPPNAGHNLVMGTELALFERPGAAAAGPAKTAGPAKSGGPADALKQKISLAFPRDTLEKTMEMLSNEINAPVVIIGNDLQLDGITKNQSFGLNEMDQPAGEILLKVLKLANPDGKLVYVIKPDAAGKDTIFITTRTAVAKRGDKLPPELEVKAAPKAK